MLKQKIFIACLALPLLVSGCAERARQQTATNSSQAAEQASTPSARMTQPVRVTEEQMDAAEPVLASAKDGTIYLAWVEHHEQGESDLWLAHLSGKGEPLDQPVRVNPKIGQAMSWRGDPPTLAVADDNTIYLGWTGRIAKEGHASNIYLSVSHDQGRSFDAPLKVNDDERPAGHGLHSLAVGPERRVYMAWLDERSIAAPPKGAQKSSGHPASMESNREAFFTFSTDGGRSFAPNKRLADEVCPCCKTSLATGPGGRVYVGWRQVLPGDFRHIAVASSSDGGQNFSAPVIVSDDRWAIPACPVSGAGLNVAEDGAVRVLWYTAGERGAPGLYWSSSPEGAQKFSERQPFAGHEPHGTPLLMAVEKNKLIAVWEDDEGAKSNVLMAQMNADGKATSAAIAEQGELPSAVVSGNQVFVAYIKKTGERRGIWLTQVQPLASS
ncbi:MAG TPA: sialidase family protein [Pyrinomonadaceae bacterium]|jgi:hypothetical protein